MNEFDPYDIGGETSDLTLTATLLSFAAWEQTQEKIFPPCTETVPERNVPVSQQYLDSIRVEHDQ